MKVNWISHLTGLTYPDKLQIKRMSDREASPELIYFWYNILHGCYTVLPSTVLDTDVKRFKEKYPDWTLDIDSWIKEGSYLKLT